MTIEKIKERIKKYEETDKVTFRVGEIVKIGEREFEFMGEDVLNKGLGFRFRYALNDWYRMNENGFSKGGWGDCDLRETLKKEIWSILSPELKSLIKDRRTVYIDENGETKDCIDKLWICSESELRGDKAVATSRTQGGIEHEKDQRIYGSEVQIFGEKDLLLLMLQEKAIAERGVLLCRPKQFCDNDELIGVLQRLLYKEIWG